MPQAIIYDKDAGLRQGISQAGGALGQALGQRGQQQQEILKQQQLTQNHNLILQKNFKDITPESTSIDIVKAVSNSMNEGAPVEKINALIKLYSPQMKAGFQAEEFSKLLNEGQKTSQGGLNDVLSESEISSTSIEEVPIVQEDVVEETETLNTPLKRPPEKKGNKLTTMSDEDLVIYHGHPNPAISNAAKGEIERRKLQHSRFEADRKFHQKGSEESIKDFRKSEKSTREIGSALRLSREAIESGETGPTSWANISKRLNVPEIMSAAGTQLNQAGKNFFFGNMLKLSAKAQNQWLEERVTKLAAETGDTRISALMKTVMLEGENDLLKAYNNEFKTLLSKDREELGYARSDLEERANSSLENVYKNIMDKTSFRTRQLWEEEKGDNWISKNAVKKVSQGTMLTPRMAKALSLHYKGNMSQVIQNAKKLGYTIPSRGDVEEWQ